MSNLQLPPVNDLTSARAYLGDRDDMRLGHNTRIRRGLGGDVVVTYHGTDIVTYTNDGQTILRANGWVTATTANRLNKLTPGHVRVGRRHNDFRVTIGDDTTTWDGYGVYLIPPTT